MNSEKQKLRSEIRTEDKWNLEAMYSDFDAAINDMSRAVARAGELITMQGHVMDSPKALLNALIAYTESMRLAERAYAYAHMKRDEDNSDAERADLFGKISMALTTLTSMTSFLDPEILSCDPALVNTYIDEEEGLGMYRF